MPGTIIDVFRGEIVNNILPDQISKIEERADELERELRERVGRATGEDGSISNLSYEEFQRSRRSTRRSIPSFSIGDVDAHYRDLLHSPHLSEEDRCVLGVIIEYRKRQIGTVYEDPKDWKPFNLRLNIGNVNAHYNESLDDPPPQLPPEEYSCVLLGFPLTTRNEDPMDKKPPIMGTLLTLVDDD